MCASSIGSKLSETEEKERKTIVEWIRLASYNPISKVIVAKKLRELLTDVTEEGKREFLLEQLQALKGERR